MPNVKKDTDIAEKHTCKILLLRKNMPVPKNLNVDPGVLEPGSLLAAQILENAFPDYCSVLHIGKNSYSDRGDILLKLSNREQVSIEMKFTVEGFTTLANLGPWIFPWMTGDSVLSYPDFVKETGCYDKKLAIVGLKPDTSNRVFVDACRKIKKLSQVKRFVQTPQGNIIHQIDELCKKEYMSLVYKNLIDKDTIGMLCTTLLRGYHTQRAIERVLNNQNVDDGRYFILKMNNSNDTLTVSGKLKDMTKSIFEVDTVELCNSQLALYAVSKNGTRFEFRLHWKNVGQGVSNPCIMVW